MVYSIHMKIKTLLPLLSLLLAIILAGCKLNPNDEFIQGTWVNHSEHFQNLTGEQHLTSTWAFSGGMFTFSACCFNIDTHQTGRYRILESEEDKLLLELFNVRGDEFSFSGELLIKINREDDTLSIAGASPYARIGP